MTTMDNPLLVPWTAPHEMPPFGEVKPEHYQPAFDAAFARHNDEIVAIIADPSQPNFDNVIGAMERSGRLLQRVNRVFFNLAATDSDEALREIEREMTPRMAAHYQAIYTNQDLFAKIDAVYAPRETSGLTSEQRRLLEETHRDFIRAGAQLNEAGRERMAEITERQAALSTQFAQNVLEDESGYLMLLEEGDLDGLPGFFRSAAAATAKERGHEAKYAVTLSRSSIAPFLQFSARRDLREEAFKAWIARGAKGGETDNRAIIAETLQLRAEKAELLGHESFAEFSLDDTMAKTPQAVHELLLAVWEPARARAQEDRDELAKIAAAEGGNFAIAPWDWRHYAEKLRKVKHDLDEAELKPYFELSRMIDAAFETARRLFGLSFKERKDLPVYHPDVRVWDVFGRDGKPVGLFIGDYFTRPSKRGGAWMSSFRDQHRLDGEVRPIIVNVLNLVKGAPGEPSLLSIDDVRTLFHEFGHGLHGLLSNVTYPSLSGTNVKRDFVELPSQLYEHWAMTPEILKDYALHAETGEPMPDALMQKVLNARKFDQGFATVEYVASALVDLELHQAARTDAAIDINAAEAKALERIGMPAGIVLRHRPPHFLHLFAGGYAAGYYSYLWSEVMDADAFGAFEEAGDVFHPETAERLHRYIYSSGGSMDPAEAYTAFRGRMPAIDALLEKRGLKRAGSEVG
ncbi:MAG: M3 family metallopeptidase [Rhodomicrobiaceae bacterium]